MFLKQMIPLRKRIFLLHFFPQNKLLELYETGIKFSNVYGISENFKSFKCKWVSCRSVDYNDNLLMENNNKTNDIQLVLKS